MPNVNGRKNPRMPSALAWESQGTTRNSLFRMTPTGPPAVASDAPVLVMSLSHPACLLDSPHRRIRQQHVVHPQPYSGIGPLAASSSEQLSPPPIGSNMPILSLTQQNPSILWKHQHNSSHQNTVPASIYVPYQRQAHCSCLQLSHYSCWYN